MLKSEAQKKISIFWFANAGVVALYFVVLTTTNKFGSQVGEAFQWYAENLVPTLMLILGAFYATLTPTAVEVTSVEPFYYRLCLGLSIFYFMVLYLTLLLAPLAASSSGASLLQTLQTSGIYLSVFQGVVSYSLGLFFVKGASQPQVAKG